MISLILVVNLPLKVPSIGISIARDMQEGNGVRPQEGWSHRADGYWYWFFMVDVVLLDFFSNSYFQPEHLRGVQFPSSNTSHTKSKNLP